MYKKLKSWVTDIKRFVFPPSVHLNLHGIGEENEIPPESPSADCISLVSSYTYMHHALSVNSLTNVPVIP